MQLFTGWWLTLSQEVRNKMREYFAIPKSEVTHVSGGRLVSDGSNDNDLKVVTVEKMQALLNSKEVDLTKLLTLTFEHFSKEVNKENTEKILTEEKKFEEVKEEENKAVEEVINKVATEVAKRRKRSRK